MNILEWILPALTGGGSGALVFVLLKVGGKYWIKNQFDKDLAQAKSEIAVVQKKRMRADEIERESISEVWLRLCDVKDSLDVFLSEYRSSRGSKINFWAVKGEGFSIWLEEADLSQDEKEKMQSAKVKDRTYHYLMILEAQIISEAYKSLRNFRSFLMRQVPSLSPKIKAKFDEVGKALNDCCWKRRSTHALQKELGPIADAPDRWHGFSEFLAHAGLDSTKELIPLLKETEVLIQTKLHPTPPKL